MTTRSGSEQEGVERYTLWRCENHGVGCLRLCDASLTRICPPTTPVEVIPTSSLTALIDQWTARADEVEAKARRQELGGVSDASRFNSAIGVALREAASDLKALIGEKQ